MTQAKDATATAASNARRRRLLERRRSPTCLLAGERDQALKDELAEANAELERIRKRLAPRLG
jgi:hypothetical protein